MGIKAKYIQVLAEVRYWEDADVNGIEDKDGDLIPLRNGDNWSPIIDIETGIINDWPIGTTAQLHYKICDAGTYNLLDKNYKLLSSFDGYVPDTMCPKDKGFGDYIIMDIDSNGKIDKWQFDEDDFIQ